MEINNNNHDIYATLDLEEWLLSNQITVPSSLTNTSFARTEDGELYSWGFNLYGQLGHRGNRYNHNNPTLVNLSPTIKVLTIACGMKHTLLLTTTCEVYSCGDNTYGELGLTHFTNQDQFQKVDVLSPDIVSISCGYRHSTAVDSKGALWGWGDNTQRQLVQTHRPPYYMHNEQNFSIPGVIQTEVKEAVCGSYYTYFIDKNNTAVSLGDIYKRLPAISIPNVKKLSCGHSHVIAVVERKQGAEVVGYGTNSRGELALSPCEFIDSPVHIPSLTAEYKKGPISIQCGMSFTVVLTGDGKMYSCGVNVLNDKDFSSDLSQISYFEDNGINVVGFAAGFQHCLALSEEGQVYSWGLNSRGELGCPESIKKLEPQNPFHLPELQDVVSLFGMQPVLSLAKKEQRKLKQVMGKMLDTGEFSDGVLSVNGGSVNVHRPVLLGRVPALAALFDKDSRVDLTPCLPHTSLKGLKFILQFIYTGNIPWKVLTMENAMDGLEFSRLFKFSAMESLLNRWLLNEIESPQNLQIFSQLRETRKSAITNWIDPKKAVSKNQTPQRNQPASDDLFLDLASLAETGLGSDHTLQVEDGQSTVRVKIHKCIVGSRSGYFGGLFRMNGKEMENHVTVVTTTMPSAVFLKMLRFLYSGNFDNFTISDCFWILLETDYFLIESASLIPHCQRILNNNLNVDNCLELFALAARFEQEELMNETVKIITKNYQQLQNQIQVMEEATKKKLMEMIASDMMQDNVRSENNSECCIS